MKTEALLEQDIRPIYNRTRDLEKARMVKAAYRDALKTPQAIVKVSSYSKGRGRLAAHLDYISRQNNLALEDPTGNRLDSKAEVKEILNHWYADADTRKNARMSANIVLSAPKGADRSAVRRAVRDFARQTFADNHDYLFAVHDDTAHPHAHLAVKLRGFDGKKLRLGKKELHQLRQGFARSLNAHGIAATASYRSDRGVGRKAERQNLRHMKARGITLEVEKQAVKEAVETLKGNTKGRPWERALNERNNRVRQRYKNLGLELASADNPDLVEIGQTISRYAKTMPKPHTRAQAIQADIRQRVEARRQSQSQSQEAR